MFLLFVPVSVPHYMPAKSKFRYWVLVLRHIHVISFGDGATVFLQHVGFSDDANRTVSMWIVFPCQPQYLLDLLVALCRDNCQNDASWIFHVLPDHILYQVNVLWILRIGDQSWQIHQGKVWKIWACDL